jgi:hypothetical protein
MSNSVIVNCACCGTPVITKHESARRTCSARCYMRLYRKDQASRQDRSSPTYQTQQPTLIAENLTREPEPRVAE